MLFVFLFFVVIIVLFGFVILFGAPYLPTLSKQQETALDLLDLKPGETLIELGSGDGRMLIAAAKRGVKSVGYELNPLLWLYSLIVTRKYKNLITIKNRNFWNMKLPECEGVYVFLLDKYMNKLYKKITQEKHSSLKLVSYAFKFPNKKHVTEKSGMYLYYFNNKKVKN